MMASSGSILFDNLVGLTDIDIEMEVKSEHDSEEEAEFGGTNMDCNSTDAFDVEFILPEQKEPDEVPSKESELQLHVLEIPQLSVSTSDDSDSDDDDDEDIEEEPEVEIDEVTVQQELVEVALDPSLLLYVNRDKKVAEEQNHQPQVQNLVENEHSKEKQMEQLESTPTINEQDCLSLPKPGKKRRASAVTAALRKVKRKPHREPLEPLNEIECSTDNIDNFRNIDINKLRHDNTSSNLFNEDDKNINDDDNDDKEIFSSPPSPGNSDSESKEQQESRIKSLVITKRKRGRPRRKPLDFIEKLTPKRKRKKKNVKRKFKTKHKQFGKKRKELITLKLPCTDEKNCASQEDESELNLDQLECNGVNKTCVNSDVYVSENNTCISDENVNKEKKAKKVKTKPSIFDEVKMDYTVLNENEPKEKHKRIRKRDKKSREMAASNKPESFDCTECGRKFKEKSHLATHARAHIDIRNFKCNKCGSLFKTKTNLFFHMKTHSDAPFTCEKCNKTYPERRTLMRHIRVVHSSQNVYSCDQCGREFKSVTNLTLHYTLHTGVKPFNCSDCNKSFVYKSTYIAHMKSHEADDSFNCELCPKTYNNKSEFRKFCNHHSESRPWLCTVCGKGYPLKGTLKNHMKTHEAEKPFKCPECPKQFMKKQSFECHLKIHAGESPQFMCDQCSQSYFNVFALKRHYLKHTSERKFVCELCNKAFWMKDALKVHMRTHSNIKMFPCSQCPKAFSHKHTLDAHLRTHLNVQPYSCSVCQKTFVHKYNLARHERQHLLSTAMPVLSPTLPPIHQPMAISVMMLPPMPPSPTTTTLHIL